MLITPVFLFLPLFSPDISPVNRDGERAPVAYNQLTTFVGPRHLPRRGPFYSR
jgi:hypothetical protein